VFELVDTTLDQMPFAVEPGIEVALHFGGLIRRDDRLRTQRVDVGDKCRAGVAAIRDDLLERDPIQLRFGLGAVVALPRRQPRP
jgi:hypothetical protein